LQLLLGLASAAIFGSESRETRDHILLSQIRDFPFCRLLRLARLRWRYSTPPPHGNLCTNCQRQSHIATDGSQSLSLGVEPHLGLMTKCLLLFESYGLFSGAPSLSRGLVSLLYMLLVFASLVFLGSKSLGTRDHILLSHIETSFHRLQRLAGSQWRYSNPTPHGHALTERGRSSNIASERTT
jgi:hypothetical protein